VGLFRRGTQSAMRNYLHGPQGGYGRLEDTRCKVRMITQWITC
jgi:hypothetical protein